MRTNPALAPQIGSRTLAITLESTLELFPPVESAIIVQANVTIFTDPDYGADADGNRGELMTTIDEVEIHTILLCVPDRGNIAITRKEGEVRYFLTRPEYERMVEEVCEKAFMEDGEEVG